MIDATFAYLNIDYPTEDEKKKPRESVDALSHYWRSVGLSVTLKVHVMEKHVSEFNDKWGIGEKEESFIELGHQTGVRNNRRYAGLTNFVKKMEATLKQRCNASHPLIVQQQQKVKVLTKRNKANEAINTKRIKLDNVKNEKEIKRDFYVSKHKIEKSKNNTHGYL